MEFLIKPFKIVIFIFFAFLSINNYAQTTVLEAFKKSYSLEKKGEYKKASDVLKEIYEPNSYEINIRLGWLNYQAGMFTEAIAHYKKALDLKPYSEEARFGLINPYAAVGKWNEVIILYNEIIENSPNNTIANYRLGLIYYGKKEYTKANVYFKRVVDLYPFGYDALLMLAWTNLQQSNLREAKVLFNKVLLYSPDDKSALEGLSLIK